MRLWKASTHEVWWWGLILISVCISVTHSLSLQDLISYIPSIANLLHRLLKVKYTFMHFTQRRSVNYINASKKNGYTYVVCIFCQKKCTQEKRRFE